MRLPDKHITYLINGFYKTLCMFEDVIAKKIDSASLSKYLHSLHYELYGLYYLADEKYCSTILTLMSILEHFYDDSLEPEPDISTIRSEVFHCMNLLDNLYEVGED